MEINQQQVEGWLRATLAAGGPIAALVLSKTGIAADDYAMYVEIALIFIPGAVSWVWSWYSHKTSNQVELIARLSALEQQAALNKVSDVAKVKIAEALPGVETVVLSNNVTDGLANLAASPEHPNIVTAAQNLSDALGGIPKPTTSAEIKP